MKLLSNRISVIIQMIKTYNLYLSGINTLNVSKPESQMEAKKMFLHKTNPPVEVRAL